jgi:hypothetical protein
MFASYDQEKLQAELARGILDVVQIGERDLLQVTNQAIRRVRAFLGGARNGSKTASYTVNGASGSRLARLRRKAVQGR